MKQRKFSRWIVAVLAMGVHYALAAQADAVRSEMRVLIDAHLVWGLAQD